MDGLIAYALSKKYVDGKTSGIATGMSWKGTKENISGLPQSGNSVGDLWHVNEDGNEYAWDGSKWEALGGIHSELPAVTSSDNGSILSVVHGAWAKNPMATQTDMSDWHSGKTVDAAVLAQDFASALTYLGNLANDVAGKADTVDLAPVATSGNYDDLTDKPSIPSLSGYATEIYVQQQIAAIPDELPTVTASDNGKFLRVVNGAWAAQTVPAAESNSFGGGS